MNESHLAGSSRIDSISCTCELWICTNCSEFQVKRDLSTTFHCPWREGLEVDIPTTCTGDQRGNSALLRFQCSSNESIVSHNIAPLEWLTTITRANMYWVLFICHALCKTLHANSHLIFTTTPCGRCHYKPIYTKEKTRLRIMNPIGRVTHLISDGTIIIINNPLVMQPHLHLEIQTIHSHFLINSTRDREEMLLCIWTISGIAGSKYSCIYFHLHQICPAVYNCYAVSKYAVHLIRGLQLTMQAINKSVDTWISIDLLGKEIHFFLWCSYSSSELAYLFDTESDIQAFKLNLPIFFSPLCLWTLHSLIKPNTAITLALFLF